MKKLLLISVVLLSLSSCAVWNNIKKNCRITNDSTSSTYKACIVCDTSVAGDIKKYIPEIH